MKSDIIYYNDGTFLWIGVIENMNNNIKIRIIKLFLSLVLLIVIDIMYSVAWFTKNEKNEINGSVFKSADTEFELVAEGTNGKYDALLNEDDGVAIRSIYIDGIPIDGENENKIENGTITSGKASIKWVVKKDGNIKNFIDTENEANSNCELQPGDYGKLEFFVVPKNNGTVNMNFTLDIDLYPLSNISNIDLNVSDILSSNTIENKLFLNHFLFFRKKNEDGYLSFLKSDENGKMTFSDKIEDAKANVAYKYEIYWVWPYLFGEVILPENHIILSGIYHPIFANSTEKDKYISNMKENYNNYFYFDNVSNSDNLVITPDIFSDDNIGNIIDEVKSGEFNYSSNNSSYSKLSYYWNKADQYIGRKISYITLEISAISGGVE